MDRVAELEARIAWYEKQLAELDGVVRELFDEVARLRREVDAIHEAGSPLAGPGDEKPPHY
ncbi:MAG: SlyX family protein [Myxococcota bacterium]